MKYEARLVVCGNDRHDFHDESPSPVADCSISKIVECICSQQSREINHLDFDNDFPSSRSGRLVCVKLPKYIYFDDDRSQPAMRLNRSLCGLKDLPRAWNKLLFNQFKKLGLQQLRSARC